MPTREKQSAFEKAFLSVAIFLLVSSLYLLTDDSLLFGRGGWGDRPVVGRVTFIENDVRRKGLDDFQWSNTHSEEEVFEGDSVFTGNLSKAIVTLKDGSIIEISSNSLVAFTSKNDQIDLDLKFGDFVGEFQASTQINIKDADEDLSVKNNPSSATATSLKISRNRRGESAIKLLSGTATLQSAGGQQLLSPDASLVVDGGGRPTERELESTLTTALQAQLSSDSLDLVSPGPGDTFWSNSETPINFTWATAGLFSEFEIEIARDERFENIAFRASSLSKNFRLQRYPRDALLYWRVNAYNSEGQIAMTSSVASFSIRSFNEIVITNPKRLMTIGIPAGEDNSTSPHRELQVAWVDRNELGTYTLELSRSPDFSDVVEAAQVRGETWTSQHLEDGVYYLRIRPDSSDVYLQTAWTEPVPFRVKTITPRARQEEKLAESIQFLPAPPMSTPAPPASSMVPKSPPATVLTERARFGNDAGQEKEIEVTWDELEAAASYEVEYSDVKDFTRRRTVFAESPAAKLRLPKAGAYYWRFRGLDENKNPVGSFSSGILINYRLMGRESLPSVREPANNTTYFRRSDGSTLVWLQWTKVEQAEKYEVEVATTKSFDLSDRVSLNDAPETRYLLSRNLAPGKYFWRVRAHIGGEPALWTEAQSFLVEASK